jgi:hypothetical protein
MPTGKIKWFNRQIGAGFIRSDDPKMIRRGQCVTFDIAKNIRSISPTAAYVMTCESWQ